MSIADKLTTIAENVPKVYAAGQKSMVDESKIIEKTASGKIISLNDVSEIPHEVSIQLSVENLFEYGTNTDYIRNRGLLEIVGDTIRYIQIAQGGTVFVNSKRYLPGVYTVLSKTTCETGITRPLLCLYDGNGELLTNASVQIPSFIYNTYYEGWFYVGSNITFTIPETVSYWCLGFAPSGGVTNSDYGLYDVFLYTQPHAATDFSGVTVKVCGKNLSGKKVINKYNYSLDYKKYNEENAIVLPKGTYCISGTPTPILQFFDVDSKAPLLVDEAVTFSGAHYKGWDGFALIPTNDVRLWCVFSLNQTAIVSMCGQNKELTDVQIEVGTYKTAYEAPMEIKEYVPNASGVVDGITSMSPNMTVFTGNADVNITAKYHKSYGMQTEYDRFWDVFQQNGNRGNYTNCFNNAAWTDEILNPKYDITVKYGEGTGLFRNCTNITNTKKPVRFKLNTGKATYVFNGCPNLETIPLLEVEEANIYTGWFASCPKLQNITIEGVIGNDISFKDSSELSNESVDSIITALKDLTGATASTLTVHADVYARMVENGQDVFVTAKNWILVSA